MDKEICPICLGAGEEMRSNSKNNGLKYVKCTTCKGAGEVDESIFEDYESEELI